ncbi:MAG TPA: aminoglycoside 6-adenylyltransferase [Pyrinomonadaceae bacterium]
MLEDASWQDAAIRDLVALLQPDEQVRAVALSGSCARLEARRDVWSDVDVLMVVAEGATGRFFPATEWLRPLGEVYAFEQNSNELTCTTRVCFSDFRRLDIVITTEAALERIDSWGSVSFWNGSRTLFSRSPAVDEILARKFAPPAPASISAEQFQSMANHFWFRAALAVTKVVRDDLLIALHLAAGLMQDCCLLALLLRDRTEGTSYHSRGSIGDDFVAEMRAARCAADAGASSIVWSRAASRLIDWPLDGRAHTRRIASPYSKQSAARVNTFG